MIDENFKTYLIEINTNPCLEFSCSLLTRVISSMIENTIRYNLFIRICIDPIFPPSKFDFSNVTKNSNVPEDYFEKN